MLLLQTPVLWKGRTELFGPEGEDMVMENVTASDNFKKLRPVGAFQRKQE